MPDTVATITDVLQFLHTQDVAMLATIKEGKAHAAAIYYHVEDDAKLYFLTKNETGKFRNLMQDNSVALVISDTSKLQTVQIEGIAREVDYTKEYSEVMKRFSAQLSQSGKAWEGLPINHLSQAGYYAFVQVTPTWIRWSDFKNWGHTILFEQKSQ